jgi:site-specific DNA-cytosine methylase
MTVKTPAQALKDVVYEAAARLGLSALTVVNFFAGIGGCALGMKWAGFKSLGSFDLDEKALRDLQRLTGGPAFVCDLAMVKLAQLLGWVPTCPDVVIMSPPCKKFSDLLPPEQAAAAEYVEMAQLALAGIYLACETWAPKLPAVIVLENVRGITGSRGALILAQIVSLLTRYGYVIDQSMHDCGEIGGIAQHRDRFLLVARQPEVAQDYLRRPPTQRVKNVGEVFEPLPSPLADHRDELHQLPRTSAMTAVRLACVDPNRVVSPKSKGDWRDIPDRVRCVWGPVPEHITVRPREGKSKQDGKHGVTRWGSPSKTVVGRGARPPSGPCSVADPRVQRHQGPARPGSRKAKGNPDDYGVAAHSRPHTTVRGFMEVQTSRASVADPHVATPQPTKRKGRKNGGSGVERWDAPAHAVLAEGTIQNCRVSVADPHVADPRLDCTPRGGVLGVNVAGEPGKTVVGHASHDNSTSSYADPKVGQAAGWSDPHRGSYEVSSLKGPARTVRGRHDPRTAPAVVDDRGWPVPTHYLVIEDGEHVLYGPELDLKSHKPVVVIILAPDGTWHRPMTDRELAVLQGFPVDAYFEGPSSTRAAQKPTAEHPDRPHRPAVPGRREHIGNAIPPPTAYAIGMMIAECLRSPRRATFLRGPDVWVRQGEEVAQA